MESHHPSFQSIFVRQTTNEMTYPPTVYLPTPLEICDMRIKSQNLAMGVGVQFLYVSVKTKKFNFNQRTIYEGY